MMDLRPNLSNEVISRFLPVFHGQCIKDFHDFISNKGNTHHYWYFEINRFHYNPP